MDYQETVAWLKSYKDNRDKIIYLKNRMTGLKAISYDEHSGQHKSMNELLDEINEVHTKMREIEDAIDNIEDDKCRLVLGYKYLMFMKYEDIAREMHYSSAQIYKLHKKGVKMIVKYSKV